VFRTRAFLLFVVAALSAFAGAVRAETSVRVLAVHPAGDVVTLGTNESFYVRLGYATDEPVRIWARPYYRGEEVRAGSNPSRLYEGSGEALGWLFFMEPGQQVDEIRITAGDGSREGTRVVASHRVRIVAGSAPAAAPAQPEWLVALRGEEQRLQREAFEQRMSTPVSGGEILLFNGFMLAVLALGIAGIVAPVRAMRRWTGGWRVAAAVPAVVMGFVVLRIIVDGLRDPTSHNLWPFEILQVGVLSLLFLGVVVVARKLTGAGVAAS
jgi:hypothetical protein